MGIYGPHRAVGDRHLRFHELTEQGDKNFFLGPQRLSPIKCRLNIKYIQEDRYIFFLLSYFKQISTVHQVLYTLESVDLSFNFASSCLKLKFLKNTETP